ncbi:MAG TPA: hypothetical protein PKA88_36715, partial [Polyangiaceae bacterium]|nr:hypothetical protein [Polyangiaceae bacterium]
AGGRVLRTFEAVSPSWLAWVVVVMLLASAFGVFDRLRAAGPGDLRRVFQGSGALGPNPGRAGRGRMPRT